MAGVSCFATTDIPHVVVAGRERRPRNSFRFALSHPADIPLTSRGRYHSAMFAQSLAVERSPWTRS
jgi:hypothetical protein